MIKNIIFTQLICIFLINKNNLNDIVYVLLFFCLIILNLLILPLLMIL
jgi:hypothetical protein